jgi:hypothetical protein
MHLQVSFFLITLDNIVFLKFSKLDHFQVKIMKRVVIYAVVAPEDITDGSGPIIGPKIDICYNPEKKVADILAIGKGTMGTHAEVEPRQALEENGKYELLTPVQITQIDGESIKAHNWKIEVEISQLEKLIRELKEQKLNNPDHSYNPAG